MQLNLKSVAALGLFGVILFSLCWLGAVLSDPSWTLGTNMVSDLGISDTNAKYFFNYGCICAGLILAASGILSAYLSQGAKRVIYFLVAVAGVALIGVGTFTEDLGWPHNTSAYIVFIAGALAAIISMILDFRNKEFAAALLTAVLIIATVAVAVTQTFPFLEAFAIIILLIWLGVTSIRTILPQKRISGDAAAA